MSQTTIDACLRNNLTVINGAVVTTTGGKPDGYVTLASANLNANCKGLNFGTGSFSVSFWVNATSNPAGSYNVLGKGGTNAGTAGWMFVHNATPKFVFQVSDGATLFTNGGSGVVIGTATWRHIVGVADRGAGTMSLYLDGTNTGSGSIAGMGSVNSTADLLFANLTTAFNGLISDAGIWSRALTQTDVTNLRNAGNGIPYPFTR